MIWLFFFSLVIFIGVAGYYLCNSADSIGDALGLSQNWVGAIMLATVTSLPELISAVTATYKLNLPELAVGNSLGGNIFNLMFVFALDFIYREKSLFSHAQEGHMLTAALGILMMGFVLFLFLLQKHDLMPNYQHLGMTSMFLPVIYILSMRTLYQFEKRFIPEDTPDIQDKKLGSKLWLVFLLSAIGVILAGMTLPHVGERIIQESGLNQAFVGSVFMAVATSCPEMAVTIASIRIGAINLALSNLLASNIFNLVIIGVSDAFFLKGPILREVSDGNILTIVSGILMTSLVMVGLVFKPTKRIMNTVTLISVLILMVYAINNFILFKLKD